MPDAAATLSRQRPATWGVAGCEARPLWDALLPQSDPATTMFRSPRYVAYLRDIGREVALFGLPDRSGRALRALVPVQASTLVMPFSVRDRIFAEMRVRSALVLGSEPMLGGGGSEERGHALDSLFPAIAERHSRAAVIDIPRLPVGGEVWRHLVGSAGINEQFQLHVLNGVRDFHSVTIPASIAELDGRLTRKRRYNFYRQERLLQQYLGYRLTLRLIEDEACVPDLLAGFESLGIRLSRRSAMTERHYYAAARHGLLRCFILSAGTQVVGIANGIRSDRIYHLDRFHHRQTLARFSPGTTLWQSVLRFLIEEASIDRVVLGFSEPVYRYSATNTVEKRARVLLFRRTAANRLRILAHSGYDALVDGVKRRWIGGDVPV